MFNNQMNVVSNTTKDTILSSPNHPQFLVIPVGIITTDHGDF